MRRVLRLRVGWRLGADTADRVVLRRFLALAEVDPATARSMTRAVGCLEGRRRIPSPATAPASRAPPQSRKRFIADLREPFDAMPCSNEEGTRHPARSRRIHAGRATAWAIVVRGGSCDCAQDDSVLEPQRLRRVDDRVPASDATFPAHRRRAKKKRRAPVSVACRWPCDPSRVALPRSAGRRRWQGNRTSMRRCGPRAGAGTAGACRAARG